MRNLEQEYKDESGYDVGKIHDIETTYFSDDYVKWLEKKVKKLGELNNSVVDFMKDLDSNCIEIPQSMHDDWNELERLTGQ